MAEKRYCIICGNEILSTDPSVVFCAQHGGTQTPPSPTPQPGETAWEANDEAPQSQPLSDITAEWEPGQTLLDTYEVIGKLGEGGMGKVYRVHHKSWNIDLAVKQPKAEIFTTQKGKEAFIREAETWVDLGLHPHTTTCYYVRTIEDIPHVFAECVEGGSLESWIQQEGFDLYEGSPSDILQRILDIAIQFAWGLAYAHECNLVHQDVKPHNVLMTLDGIVKVTDFGLAKARAEAGESPHGSESRVLVSGSLNTREYRSPEQAQGDLLSHKTDIWSWGVSILELFNGGVSWLDGQSAATSLESYLARASDTGIPLMPSDLAELLQQCFQKDPQHRPWNMLVIGERLQGIYQQSTGHSYPRQFPEPAELRADSLNNKAVSMLDLGHNAEAVKSWEAAKLNNPHHAETAFNLGYWQWQHGEQTDQTYLEQIGAVCAQHPERQDLNWFTGVVQAELGNLESATRPLEKAWSQQHWQAGLLLTACLATMGDSSTGKQILTQLLSEFGSEVTNTLGATTLDGVWSNLNQHPLPWRRCNLRIAEESYENRFGLLSITPDGHYALACAGRELVLYDLHQEKAVSTLKKRYAPNTSIVGMELSLDGQRAASVADDKTIVIWDAPVGKVLSIIKGLPEYPGVNAFTPDLHYLVYLDSMHHLCMWDLERQACIMQLQIPVEPPKSSHIMTRHLALSADGSFCLLIMRNELFGLQLPQGYLNFRHQFDPDFVNQLVMTHDGRYALAGGEKGRLWVWDLQKLNYQPLEGLEHHITNLAITSDARYALSSSRGEYLNKDNTLRLWDIEKRVCLWTSEKQGDGKPITPGSLARTTIKDICAIAISPDAKYAYSYGRYGPLQRYVIYAGREVNARRFSPLPTAFATPLSGGRVLEIIEHSQDQLAQAQALEKAGKWAQAYQLLRQVQQESLDPWEESVLTALHRLGAHGQHSGLRAAALKTRLSGHSGRIFTLALRPGTLEVLTGGDDYELRWWDLENNQCLAAMDCEKTSIKSISIDPKGRYALLGGGGMNIYGDFLLRLFDFQTQRIASKINLSEHMTLDITFGTNENIAAAVSDRFIYIINPLTGKVFYKLKGHAIHIGGKRDSAGTPICAAFFPEGRYVLSGGDDQTICLWDLSIGKRIRRYQSPQGHVEQVFVTPDGQRILSGHSDHFLRVWNVESEEPVLEIDTGGRVEHFALTSDSRFVFSSGEDNSIKLWDLQARLQCGLLEGHGNLVSGLVLANDERWLVTSSWDGTVGIWELDWDYEF